MTITSLTVGELIGWEARVAKTVPPPDDHFHVKSQYATIADGEWPFAEANTSEESTLGRGMGSYAVYCSPTRPGDRFWGIHIDSELLDRAAGTWLKTLPAQAGVTSAWPMAAILPFGMALEYLKFYAVIDIWLRRTYKSQGGRKFGRISHPPHRQLFDEDNIIPDLCKAARNKPTPSSRGHMLTKIWSALQKNKSSKYEYAILCMALGTNASLEWLSNCKVLATEIANAGLQDIVIQEIDWMDAGHCFWRAGQSGASWQSLAYRLTSVGSNIASAAQSKELLATVRSYANRLSAAEEVPVHIHGQGIVSSAIQT
ncbi:MAG: hypothetical protein IPG93_10145 [Burkholderiales bacterium]|nr:hypothetical protein [Burkholderiales bacterium]